MAWLDLLGFSDTLPDRIRTRHTNLFRCSRCGSNQPSSVMGNVAPQARCRLSYSGWLEIKLSMKEIECFKKVAFLAVGIHGHLHSTNITSCSILLSHAIACN